MFGILAIIAVVLGVIGYFSEEKGALYFGGAIICLFIIAGMAISGNA